MKALHVSCLDKMSGSWVHKFCGTHTAKKKMLQLLLGGWVSLQGVVAHILGYNIIVSELELQLHYYIHFLN